MTRLRLLTRERLAEIGRDVDRAEAESKRSASDRGTIPSWTVQLSIGEVRLLLAAALEAADQDPPDVYGARLDLLEDYDAAVKRAEKAERERDEALVALAEMREYAAEIESG